MGLKEFRENRDASFGPAPQTYAEHAARAETLLEQSLAKNTLSVEGRGHMVNRAGVHATLALYGLMKEQQ